MQVESTSLRCYQTALSRHLNGFLNLPTVNNRAIVIFPDSEVRFYKKPFSAWIQVVPYLILGNLVHSG